MRSAVCPAGNLTKSMMTLVFLLRFTERYRDRARIGAPQGARSRGRPNLLLYPETGTRVGRPFSPGIVRTSNGARYYSTLRGLHGLHEDHADQSNSVPSAKTDSPSAHENPQHSRQFRPESVRGSGSRCGAATLGPGMPRQPRSSETLVVYALAPVAIAFTCAVATGLVFGFHRL